MKTRRNTSEYSFLHTQERLKERYDLDITQKEYDRIQTQVRLHAPDYLEYNASETQGIYELMFKGKKVVFVYSFTHARIKTVLPPRIRGNW